MVDPREPNFNRFTDMNSEYTNLFTTEERNVLTEVLCCYQAI